MFLSLLAQITIIKVPKGSFWDSFLSGEPSFWFFDYMGYVWLGIAILFLFAELNTPGLFFFISFAVGSFVAAIFAFLGYSLVIQCLIALFISVIAFLVMKKYIKKQDLSRVEYGEARSNVDALVGTCGMVTSEIGSDVPGTVKIGGEYWRARSKDSVALSKGKRVCVLRVEGNTVIVEPNESSFQKVEDDSSTKVGENDGDV